jgi:hypothetical protein
MWKGASLKVPKHPAAVAWLESYATDAAIDAATDKFLTAKQQAGEGEDAFATRLRRYAAEAGKVYKEDSLVSRYLAGLDLYIANTIRVHVSPCMRFTQVKNLSIGRPCGKGSRSLQPEFNSRPRSGFIHPAPPRSGGPCGGYSFDQYLLRAPSVRYGRDHGGRRRVCVIRPGQLGIVWADLGCFLSLPGLD